MLRAVFLCAAILAAVQLPAQTTQASTAERTTYLQAIDLLRKGQFSNAKALEDRLSNYILTPYLEYHRLNSNLARVSPAQIDGFRQRHPTLPVTPLLYQRWLILQGQNRQWRRLHEREYDTQNSELACYFVRAQYGIGEKAQALDRTTAIWAKPKSQPKACDPIFAVWRQTPRFTQAIIWQRFAGAMTEGEYVLARYLQRYMTGTRRDTARAFYELRRQPQRLTWRGAFARDNAENRQAISYGIQRLGRKDAAKAAKVWNGFRQSHDFSPTQRQRLDDLVAINLAQSGRFPAAKARSQITSEFAVHDLFSAGIAQQQWPEVLYWSSRMEPEEADKDRVRYWQARAQGQLQKQSSDSDQFGDLLTKRNYYGFLAAAQVNAPTAMQAMPAHQLTREQEQTLLAIPGIARAVELFATGDDLNGKREWYAQLAVREQADQHHMAHLAQRIGQLYLAIQTANNAGMHDDLELRFPTTYGPLFDAAALRHNINANLLRAITRQESAFQPKVKSSAGALGLMQVIPSTAKIAIRRGGLKRHLGPDVGLIIEQDLRRPELNIDIGAFHLSWLIERYDGVRPLAIAAYNAGENRVDKWASVAGDVPMDVWIETIPFSETRNYVQNVLAFAVVYGNLNQRSGPILKSHEWRVPAGS